MIKYQRIINTAIIIKNKIFFLLIFMIMTLSLNSSAQNHVDTLTFSGYVNNSFFPSRLYMLDSTEKHDNLAFIENELNDFHMEITKYTMYKLSGKKTKAKRQLKKISVLSKEDDFTLYMYAMIIQQLECDKVYYPILQISGFDAYIFCDRTMLDRISEYEDGRYLNNFDNKLELKLTKLDCRCLIDKCAYYLIDFNPPR